MGKYLSKAEIVAAQDLTGEDVDVPEWGGTVRVGMMSALEKDAFEGEQFTVRIINGKPRVDTHLENASARLAARCIKDENGERLFSDEEIELLGQKSAAALARVTAVAQRLNGISNKEIKELAETLKNDQPASSATD